MNWTRLRNAWPWFAVLILVQAGTLYGQADFEYRNARMGAINNTLVSSETPGIVKTIDIQSGLEIEEHAALVQLNTEVYLADFEVAEAEEQIAELNAGNRVNLEYAEKSAAVTEKTLLKSLEANRAFAKTISSTEISRLQLELDKAVLSGQQAALEFESAQWMSKLRERKRRAAKVLLENRTIRAPFGGTVAQVHVQLGQWVNTGEPIARIIDLDHLRVEGYFSQELVRQVKVGCEATYEYSLGGEIVRVPVTVSFVSPEVVEGIFQVWADLDNTERKHVPGVQGTLTLHITN